jgi:hypothetical protein
MSTGPRPTDKGDSRGGSPGGASAGRTRPGPLTKRKCIVCGVEKYLEFPTFYRIGRGFRKTCRECELKAKDPVPEPAPGDDLFYLADAVKMVADQLVEVTRQLGVIRKELHECIQRIQGPLTPPRPPQPTPAG